MSEFEDVKQLEEWAEQEGVDTEGIIYMYQSNVKYIIELCFAIIDERYNGEYSLSQHPKVRECLIKEGLAFPKTKDELILFEKHHDKTK